MANNPRRMKRWAGLRAITKLMKNDPMMETRLSFRRAGRKVWKDGQYESKCDLGEGAYGTAVLVHDKKAPLESRDAVKVIKFIRLDEDSNQLPEVRNLWELKRHTNVVMMYDTFMERDFLCIVTEFCEGLDLDKKIQRKRDANRKFSYDRIIDYFLQMVLAVEFIHSKNIIHRDLKPGNVFLCKGIVKIGDFGISKTLMQGDRAVTMTGTPNYMSPEILKPNSEYSHSADIWSLGCILYEMCEFKRAFPRGGIHDIIDQTIHRSIPELSLETYGGLADVYESVMQMDPDERLTASELLQTEALASALNFSKTVLLVGMTGSGKSNLGNLLAGKHDAFRVSGDLASCTREHLLLRNNKDHLTLVDSMGLCDTDDETSVVLSKISEALVAARNGVDIIFFCMVFTKLTQEQYSAFDAMMSMFGQECSSNLVLVYTHSPKLMKTDLAGQIAWCKRQCGGDSVTAANFRRMYLCAQKRVLFIENPSTDEDETGDDDDKKQNEKHRVMARKSLLDLIRQMNPPKYYSETETLAREMEKAREKEAAEVRASVDREIAAAKLRETQRAEEFRREKEQIEREAEKKLRQMQQAEQKRLERVQLHEYLCKRKKCEKWRKWLKANTTRVWAQLWREHVADCSKCRACRMCGLENKGDRTAAEDQELETLHVADIERLKSKSERNKCPIM